MARVTDGDRVRPGVLKDDTVEAESADQQGGLEGRGATGESSRISVTYASNPFERTQ